MSGSAPNINSQAEGFTRDNYIPLKEAAIKISGNSELAEELLHYTLAEFLQKKDVDTIIQSGGGRFYCVRIMMNSWNSTTSPFYFTYRAPSIEYTDLLEYENIYEEPEDFELTDPLTLEQKVQLAMRDLPWYEKKLFDVFVKEAHTFSSLSRATGIPRTSISLTINRIRAHIKKSL